MKRIIKANIDGFEKDLNIGVIQPTDVEYNKFIKERNKIREEQKQKQEMAELKNDMVQIKSMLAQLLGKN